MTNPLDDAIRKIVTACSEEGMLAKLDERHKSFGTKTLTITGALSKEACETNGPIKRCLN